jgi:hypothetical protein
LIALRSPCQIDLLTLREQRDQEHRHLGAAVKCDHPIAAALAFPAAGEPHLARTTGAGDQVARRRCSGNTIDDPPRLGPRSSSVADRSSKAGQFDDRLHAFM